MTKKRAVLLMLERWIEPVVRHMEPEFTTHAYIEKLRQLYPGDYAHDLTLCTLEQGFPKSMAILHRAIVDQLRKADSVKVVGTKESRDFRGNKHRTLVWRRLDARKPPRRPREPVLRGAASLYPDTRPPMRGFELREARIALGWTMAELARRAGVSLASVSRWEREERQMSLVSAEAIRRALQAGRSERGKQGSPVARRSTEKV